MTGEPVFRDLFLEVLRRRDGEMPGPRIDARFFRRGFAGDVAFSSEFHQRLGISKLVGALAGEPFCACLAASVQEACSIIVIELLEAVRQECGGKCLWLAGGLFLNPLVVAAVEKNTGFDQVFVQPAAGNEGTALGAAWLAHHRVHKNPRSTPLERLDWGPSYSNEEIKRVLDNCKVSYRFTESEDRKIEAALKLLDAGKIVAWFQGAAEFGPRALGNRSPARFPLGGLREGKPERLCEAPRIFQALRTLRSRGRLLPLFRLFSGWPLHGDDGFRAFRKQENPGGICAAGQPRSPAHRRASHQSIVVETAAAIW